MKLNLWRLKTLRKCAGITQEEMAKRMGFKARSSYSNRENGNIYLGADELTKIAEILNQDDNMENFFEE